MTLGKVAYLGYINARGFPDMWEDLSDYARTSWEAAALAVLRESEMGKSFE